MWFSFFYQFYILYTIQILALLDWTIPEKNYFKLWSATSLNFYLYEFLIQHCAIKSITLFALSQLQSYFGLGAESQGSVNTILNFCTFEHMLCEGAKGRPVFPCKCTHGKFYGTSSQFGHNCFLHIWFPETRQKLDIIFLLAFHGNFQVYG